MWASHNWQLHHDNAPARSHTWSRVSWPNMGLQLFARLPTLQTWLLLISGCSPNWRGHWRVPVLTVAWTSCGTRWRSWEAFQKCFQQ
jgi:hypothetical protein